MRFRALLFALLVPAFAASAFAYRISIWIPSWSSDATTSIQQNAGDVQESNPVWYSWNADGSIAKNWNAENPTIRAAMTGTRVVPTIQNVISGSFDGTTAATILGNATTRDAQVAALFQLVTTNAYDGIDVDYERVPTTSRADFTTFVTSLAQKLHSAGKTLSVSVYAKTSDSENWNGPGAEDWNAIGAVADSVKIMAYDYSWSTSAPGPITPLQWLDAIATYAESAIPAAKIFIGLPFYGYDWSGGSGTGVSYATATQTAQANGATIQRDANGEPNFTYGSHTVYFEDAYSYAQKLDVIRRKHPAIGGLAHWAAGQEDPMTWSFISGQLPAVQPAQPAPPGPSVPSRFRSVRH